MPKNAPKWASALIPKESESQRDDIKTRIMRKQIRYWLFRLKTEADGGTKAPAVPKGLKAHFKKAKWFDGWENFGVSWDTNAQEPWTTVERLESIHEEYDAALEEVHRQNTRQARRRKRASDGGKGNV